MRNYLLPLLLLSMTMVACHKPGRVSSAQTESISINESLDAIQDSAYLQEIARYNTMLDAELDVVLGHAPEALTVHQPECLMLNWASDALFQKAVQYFPGQVDGAVVNIGGMRCEWPAGDITRRNVFELMPFDNQLVVLTLTGEDLLELFQIFVVDGGQGIANMRVVGEDRQLADATIGGKQIVPEQLYHIATSDYLAGGTDHMTPLTHAVERWDSGLTIRDLYMDYVAEQKDVVAKIDGRMMIL